MSTNDDYKDFWEEFRLVQETQIRTPIVDEDDINKLEIDETENNAELLRAMGMGHLVDMFRQYREISETDLNGSIDKLSKLQADTVRLRVRALNNTVRSQRISGRQARSYQRKPDIRNVFRDVETSSTGTRSRSATPDSLDSVSKLESATVSPVNWNSSSSPVHWSNNPPKHLTSSVPSFVKIFNQSEDENGDNDDVAIDDTGTITISENNAKESLRRTPSAPPSCNRNTTTVTTIDQTQTNVHHTQSSGGVRSTRELLTSHEMFSPHSVWSTYRDEVASNSEGIELLGFNRIGTFYSRRSSRERARIIRDSTSKLNIPIDIPNINEIEIKSCEPMSFEMAFNGIQHNSTINTNDLSEEMLLNSNENEDTVLVDDVTDLDFKDMTPILWMELCLVFDKQSLIIHRRKPLKRKRKEDGNVFGVNLSTLVMRDYRLINDSSTTPVPSIIRDLLSRLSGDRLNDEGLLRIAGNKQRVEMLCNEVEMNYYKKPTYIVQLLDKSTSHELVSILKKLLRDLPQPLLTFELIHLFYECHEIKHERILLKALNLLILLLPVENRSTLYLLLEFLMNVVRNETVNKMNLHNVAMIIAPSLFPVRYVQGVSTRTTTLNVQKQQDIGTEISYAANCCRLTQILIQGVDRLKTIPANLLKQARECTETTQNHRRKTAAAAAASSSPVAIAKTTTVSVDYKQKGKLFIKHDRK